VNKLLLILVLFFFGACGWIFNKEPNQYGGSWTDCSYEYISPENSYQVFESDHSNGFWVTVIDSSDQAVVPNTAIRYGRNPEIISGKTDLNRTFWINSTKLDTVFLTYIGFDNQYFFRDSKSIDSVVVSLRPCIIHLY